jgi:hypothetical protein
VKRDRLDDRVRPWIDTRDGARERVRHPHAFIVGRDAGGAAADRDRLAHLAGFRIDA